MIKINMTTFIWVFLILAAFDCGVRVAYLVHSDYPRERSPNDKATDTFSLIVHLLILAWAIYLVTSP